MRRSYRDVNAVGSLVRIGSVAIPGQVVGHIRKKSLLEVFSVGVGLKGRSRVARCCARLISSVLSSIRVLVLSLVGPEA
jgi:hypothetical protein